ncbi:MAG TPA: lipocalin family protein [Caulobacteraceae bacterium]|nr:lipocalin family protein [Caulobacteraceae bacterium]
MRAIFAAPALALALSLAGAGQAAAPAPKKPIAVERFLGRWYEVARTANARQKDCHAPIVQWSRAKDGKISVNNICHKGSPDGSPQSFKGTATVLDAARGRIQFSFLGGAIKQEYWILDRADDYSWAIMGTPGGNFVWAFSRKAALTDAEQKAMVARIKGLGYSVAKLELAGRKAA